MKTRILVTGGGGYLGTSLVPRLLKAGHRVHLVDLFYFGEEAIEGFKNHPQFSFSKIDVADVNQALLEDVDTLVHLAGLSNDPSCELDTNWSLNNDFFSTEKLARNARTAGVKRMVFASSCSIYGSSGQTMVDENSPAVPTSLYARMKIEVERELSRLASPGFQVVRLRLATLFGLSPRMRFDLVVNAMVMHALKTGTIIIHGDGNQHRPLIHVRDAASAIACVIEKNRGSHDEVYNVGTDSLNVTVSDLAHKIAEYFRDIRIIRDPSKPDNRSYWPDFTKFSSAFAFRPENGIAHAVKEISGAYKKGALGAMDDIKYFTAPALKRWQPPVSMTLRAYPDWAKEFLPAA